MKYENVKIKLLYFYYMKSKYIESKNDKYILCIM